MSPRKIISFAVIAALSASVIQTTANAANLTSRVQLPACGVPDTEQAFNLHSAIERALCANPETRAAAARLVSSQAQEGQAGAALAPQVSGSATTTRSKAEESAGVTGSVAQLRMSYVLFDFGKRRAATEAARASVLASEMDAQSTAQALILDTANKYFAVLSAQQAVETANAALTAAKTSRDAAQARYSTGVAPRVEMLQAQSRLAEAELAAVRANSAVSVAVAALAQQMGLKASTRLTVAETGSPAQADLPAVELLMEEARTRRPEARAALSRLEAARAQERSADAQDKPTVSVNVTGARNITSSASTTNQASIGLVLDIPLYDGGLARNQKLQAKAQADLAEASLDSQLQAVDLSVVQAYAQLSSAQLAYQSAESFLNAAQAAEEQASGRYRAGVGTLTDWLDAQTSLNTARQQRVAAVLGWHTAKLAMSRAVGSLDTTSF